MRHSLWALLWLCAVLLVSCSSDEMAGLNVQHSIKLHVRATVRPFDVGSDTRGVTDWTWADGDVIFLQFKNGDNYVRGHAVYKAADETWEVPSWEGALATKGICELVYFDGVSVTDKKHVALTPFI